MFKSNLGGANLFRDYADSDVLIQEFESNNKYLSIELGLQEVDPRLIIGLSRVPVESQLEDLLSKVQEMGWNDPTPQGVQLQMFPNGKYVVHSGGNHRAVVSRELNIPSIHASVTAYLAEEKISKEEYIIIEETRQKLDDLKGKVRLLPMGDIEQVAAEITYYEQELNDYLMTLYFRDS
mgnify:CR=1 FL=1